MEFKEVFEKFDIFEDLTGVEQKMLSGFFERLNFKPEQAIFHEGEEGGSLCLLLKGKVRICRKTKDGDLLCYATVVPGETFGLMSFLDGERHNATTIADKDSEVVKIEKSDFDTLYEKDPLMVAKILGKIGTHLCEIIRAMNTQYMDLSTYMFKRSK